MVDSFCFSNNLVVCGLVNACGLAPSGRGLSPLGRNYFFINTNFFYVQRKTKRKTGTMYQKSGGTYGKPKIIMWTEKGGEIILPLILGKD